MDVKRFEKLPILGILRGIEPETLEPLIEAVVASAVAFGASVFRREWLEKGNFSAIRECIKKFVSEGMAYGA